MMVWVGCHDCPFFCAFTGCRHIKGYPFVYDWVLIDEAGLEPKEKDAKGERKHSKIFDLGRKFDLVVKCRVLRVTRP
jgi:hypothetical protein